jgi:hypothetical protein
MDFDVFAPGRSATDDPTVASLRVLASGRLVFNPAAQKLLGDAAFVQLFWDGDTARIGILPADDGDADAFPVVHSADQAIVTSTAFVERYDLPLSISMRLAWADNMWVASTLHPDEPIS